MNEKHVDEALQLQLDNALNSLAQRYASQPLPPHAEEETLQALKTFTRALTDDELDWLAAAGPGVSLPPPESGRAQTLSDSAAPIDRSNAPK